MYVIDSQKALGQLKALKSGIDFGKGQKGQACRMVGLSAKSSLLYQTSKHLSSYDFLSPKYYCPSPAQF